MTFLRFSPAAGLLALLLVPAAAAVPLDARTPVGDVRAGAGSDLDRLSEVPQWASEGGSAAEPARGALAGGGAPTPGTPPPAIPVDGGLVALAVAGAAYAARRLRARR